MPNEDAGLGSSTGCPDVMPAASCERSSADRYTLVGALRRRLRSSRYQDFMAWASPSEATRVLDVGVSARLDGEANFFERMYPWGHRITALVHEDPQLFGEFQAAFPQVRLVSGDGRRLPFDDDSFDVVFSNAVLEHVGTRDEQAEFVSECLRVGRRLYLATPDARCPVDPHTLLPFVHWFPRKLRRRIYPWFGQAWYVDEAHLNLIGRKGLRALVSLDAYVECSVRTHRLLGVPVTLSLMVERTHGQEVTSAASVVAES